MSEQQQLKKLLDNVLERKNKTMNTIYNDLNLDVKILKPMVEDLRITKESFETDVTAIVTMVLEESKSNGRIASVLIFSMELDAHLTKNSSSWYRRCMLVETLIPLLCKNQLSYKYLFYFFIISSIVILLTKS